MLLTGGQISLTISSCIVFIFTSLLFISGYVLQQQTVKNLQAVIHPPKPSLYAQASASAIIPPSRVATGTRAHHEYQKIIAAAGGRAERGRGSAQMAFVQLVTERIHVCNALMLFAELHRQKNKAARVLLYPKIWHTPSEELEDDPETARHVETSERLFREASEKYDVTFKAIEPLIEGSEPTSPLSYPPSVLFSLTKYDRLLYIPPSGILLDQEPLDALFDVPLELPMIAFPPPVDAASGTTTTTKPSIFLLQPSKTEYTRSKELLSTNSSLFDPILLAAYYNTTTNRDPQTQPPQPPITLDPSLILRTSTLRHLRPDITTRLSTPAYLHLSDPNLPGPEYNIPRRKFLSIRPEAPQARRLWEFAYETFRERRMAVCGLDLEPWDDDGPGSASSSSVGVVVQEDLQ